MNYNTLVPASNYLKGFIKCFYDHQCEVPFSYYAMAEIYPKLYFRYSGNTKEILTNGKTKDIPFAALHGQRSSHQLFTFQKNFATFGVHLYPHTIPLLFNIPATETQDQLIDLQKLLGSEGLELECQILHSKDFPQRKKIIEDFVFRKLISNYKSEMPVFLAINTIIQNKGLINIKQLASNTYISERQFGRQFNKFAGLNPKLFARIVRFKNAIEYASNKTATNQNLTEIACACGYYDQSHFIHEFKTFSGFKPSEFFAEKSPVIILPH